MPGHLIHSKNEELPDIADFGGFAPDYVTFIFLRECHRELPCDRAEGVLFLSTGYIVVLLGCSSVEQFRQVQTFLLLPWGK
ncbi:hypothetical protein XELAEV_18011551mg [Xenopus laevis]|uniref:Uncharacterized protein n=1 Tax=Xenopus laevis TaxID=8355 RepID=A0A974DM33_XENLA|nr:hypothetical protein XELAEV_18011551mg [Xenopus laevis]